MTENTNIKQKDSGGLFVGSDFHIGAPTSTFKKYKEAIERAMDKSDRVMLNGDIFELFYLMAEEDKNPASSRMGEVLEFGRAVKRSAFNLIRFLGIEVRYPKGEELVEEAIKNATEWLEKLAAEKPDRQIRFVLGNHENILDFHGFRESLDVVKECHPNFRWDPEMIIEGNGKEIHVHGDLQLNRKRDGRVDALREHFSIEEAARESPDARFFWDLEVPGFGVLDKYFRSPEKSAAKIYKQLQKRAKNGSEYVALSVKTDRSDIEESRLKDLRYKIMRYNGGEIFTLKEWAEAEHVFSGHTHSAYENFVIGTPTPNILQKIFKFLRKGVEKIIDYAMDPVSLLEPKGPVIAIESPPIKPKKFHNTGGSTEGPEGRGYGNTTIAAELEGNEIVAGTVVSHESYLKQTLKRAKAMETIASGHSQWGRP